MSRGKKRAGATGCAMTLVGTKRLPKWMAKTYEERAAKRDAASSRRLQRLAARNKIETMGPAKGKCTCGLPTVLEARFCLITNHRTQYGSFCAACRVFA